MPKPALPIYIFDQRYTHYKSITKYIRQNCCRALNKFLATNDSTVLACESNIGKEVDKHIVTFDHAPTTGNMKTCLEIVKDEIGLTPTSIMTFFSLLIKVGEVTRRDNNIGLRSPTLTVNIEGWENDGWINLIQSYDVPEEKQKCLYCGECPRNLQSHIRINHDVRSRYSLEFSGEILVNGSTSLRKAFESDLASRCSMYVNKKSRLRTVSTTYDL